MHRGAASPDAAAEVLHVTVERATDLLRASKSHDESDCFVTVRALPAEAKHSRRTVTKQMTRDPVRTRERGRVCGCVRAPAPHAILDRCVATRFRERRRDAPPVGFAPQLPVCTRCICGRRRGGGR
jgi:hypothetical protein